eukprot:m.430211 g.430211  ORF g.430211 m.430211 type:complete len:294 (+) comp56726_c0_seq30:127-1008(+)
MVNCTIACPTVQATPSSYSLWLQALSYLVLGMWCVLLLIRDYQRASISFRPQVLAAQLVLCFFRSLTTFIALPWADEFAMYLITYTVPIFFQFLVIFLLLLFLGRSYVALSSRYRKLAVDIGFGTLCVVCMVLCVLDATFSAQDSGGSFYDQRISYLGAFMFGFIGFLTAFVGTLVFWKLRTAMLLDRRDRIAAVARLLLMYFAVFLGRSVWDSFNTVGANSLQAHFTDYQSYDMEMFYLTDFGFFFVMEEIPAILLLATLSGLPVNSAPEQHPLLAKETPVNSEATPFVRYS